MAKKRGVQDAGTKNAAKATKKDQTIARRQIGKSGADNRNLPVVNGSVNSIPLFQIVVGILFFCFGVATPPLLSAWSGRGFYERKTTTGKNESEAKEADGRTGSYSGLQSERRAGLTDFMPLEYACDDVDLSEFLHDNPQRGMHVACLKKGNSGFVDLRLFRRATNQTSPQIESKPTWRSVRTVLETNLSLPASGPLQQPWAIFTPRGERIVGADDEIIDEKGVIESLVRSGMIIVMDGGNWIWPGVRVGFKRTIDLYSVMPGFPGASMNVSGRKAIIETLSLRPLVVSVKGFISKEECMHIRELAAPSLRYSQVSLMDHDKGRPASDWRTSQSTFLSAGSDSIMRDLEDRTASLTRLPKNHQEHVQVLRYGNGEKYDAHHDYFDPAVYQNDKQTLMQIQNGKRNRLATVFWYLSDVEKGGETIFPRLNGANPPMDYSDCSKGLKVKPEEGKVIIFYSLNAAGRLDPFSLHGACKVEEGVKWAANKWVWNAPRDFI